MHCSKEIVILSSGIFKENKSFFKTGTMQGLWKEHLFVQPTTDTGRQRWTQASRSWRSLHFSGGDCSDLQQLSERQLSWALTNSRGWKRSLLKGSLDAWASLEPRALVPQLPLQHLTYDISSPSKHPQRGLQIMYSQVMCINAKLNEPTLTQVPLYGLMNSTESLLPVRILWAKTHWERWFYSGMVQKTKQKGNFSTLPNPIPAPLTQLEAE